ncbi:hypothetical protein ACFLYS_00355 [Chloroflexota bacterium]
MEDKNQWYEGIEIKILSIKEKVSKSDYKLYGVDLLLRAAKRVDTFSSDCEHCQGHRNDISKLVTNLENLPKITEKEVSYYDRTLRNLEKRHGLHRIVPTALYILIPLLIAIVALLIYLGIAHLQDSQVDLSDGIARIIIGSLLFIITMIVGFVFGILRIFKIRI